jgi:hypothetical protein
MYAWVIKNEYGFVGNGKWKMESFDIYGVAPHV